MRLNVETTDRTHTDADDEPVVQGGKLSKREIAVITDYPDAMRARILSAATTGARVDFLLRVKERPRALHRRYELVDVDTDALPEGAIALRDQLARAPSGSPIELDLRFGLKGWEQCTGASHPVKIVDDENFLLWLTVKDGDLVAPPPCIHVRGRLEARKEIEVQDQSNSHDMEFADIVSVTEATTFGVTRKPDTHLAHEPFAAGRLAKSPVGIEVERPLAHPSFKGLVLRAGWGVPDGEVELRMKQEHVAAMREYGWKCAFVRFTITRPFEVQRHGQSLMTLVSGDLQTVAPCTHSNAPAEESASDRFKNLPGFDVERARSDALWERSVGLDWPKSKGRTRSLPIVRALLSQKDFVIPQRLMRSYFGITTGHERPGQVTVRVEDIEIERGWEFKVRTSLASVDDPGSPTPAFVAPDEYHDITSRWEDAGSAISARDGRGTFPLEIHRWWGTVGEAVVYRRRLSLSPAAIRTLEELSSRGAFAGNRPPALRANAHHAGFDEHGMKVVVDAFEIVKATNGSRQQGELFAAMRAGKGAVGKTFTARLSFDSSFDSEDRGVAELTSCEASIIKLRPRLERQRDVSRLREVTRNDCPKVTFWVVRFDKGFPVIELLNVETSIAKKFGPSLDAASGNEFVRDKTSWRKADGIFWFDKNWESIALTVRADSVSNPAWLRELEFGSPSTRLRVIGEEILPNGIPYFVTELVNLTPASE